MSKKPAKKRNALGRGLGALLDDSPSFEQPKTRIDPTKISNLSEIPVDKIETNPYQPRTDFDQTALNELADSIKVQGIIQPITVRKLSRDQFQLISGERRLQASKIAGLTHIPAYIRTADDQQMVEMALIENIQRENLNAIEIALSYQRLISECNLKQEELGERVGKNRTTVTNYLRLLKLPPDIQVGVRDGKISMGHARALIGLENADLQLTVYKKILQQDLSVRKVEDLVRSLGDAPKPKEKPGKELDYETKKVQNQLSSHFGTKVVINSNDKHKGKIQIPFNSVDDLNRILEIIDL